ncbi:MAG: 50S ribosomal protein L29 [Bacteroidetes bacterium]|nr:MAG: 50S ribosomal protein L29 [Bacteroidota bacterium]
MASKKFLELQGFTDEQLTAELEDLQAQYQRLKFDHAVKGLDNPMVLREMRRDIARLHTEIRRRQLAAMSEEQLAKRSKLRARRARIKKRK